jgi:hypothetical protein
MHIIQNYTLKKNVVKHFFAAGDGVASKDQESVQIANSPTRRYGKSATPRLADAGSRRLPDSPIRGVDFRLRISPRIRSQNRDSLKASVWDYADLNYAKTSENSVHCCVPLIKKIWGLTVVINERIL